IAFIIKIIEHYNFDLTTILTTIRLADIYLVTTRLLCSNDFSFNFFKIQVQIDREKITPS
ncbi:MAG: hypothetical protein RR219_09835, partial [Clostridiales bacterium]